MKTIQEIKSELLRRCEDLYQNYLVMIDNRYHNLEEENIVRGEYRGFKEACEFLGEDLKSEITRMEARVHAERYVSSGIDELLGETELDGFPTQ